MPYQTKVFRVFVSSTFTDMRAERNILQRKVFPRLERYCEKKGARFQGVDLRWGVNEESQLNQQTLRICLNEIDRCKRITPKPNFLILLGDKYGWQPIPPSIPEKEMSLLLSAMNDEEKDLITGWYRLDENAVPAEYLLQPRGELYKERIQWSPAEENIRVVLRKAVSMLNFPENQKVKYFASATHQEILRGALNPVDGTDNPEEHVFAFVREAEGLPADDSARDYRDMKDGEPDKESREGLEELKAELRLRLGDNYIRYNARWKEDKLELLNQSRFGSTIYKKLRRIIDSRLQAVGSANETGYEVKLHQEFRERLTGHFRGREGILNSIRQYINNSGENKIMALIGDSGSGKSSVMAEAARQAETGLNGSCLVYRFIGTTSRSSSIIYLLQGICGQIAMHYGTTLESLAGAGNENSLYDVYGLSVIFRKSLQLATTEKPLILFLDALDQLADNDNAKQLSWLPEELPDHAKVIVSALPELEPVFKPYNLEKLPVLPAPEARQILDQWLNALSRKLTERQFEEVISKFILSGLPLYLRLAFERARHWHSYDTDADLKGDIKGIINNFFYDLEKEHTTELVTNAVCYMLCGKYQGLAENEILEILAFDNDYWNYLVASTHENHRQELIDQMNELKKGNMKIPIVIWSRLYLDLEPYLTERDADGVAIITFFHRQFNEVLKERYDLTTDRTATSV